MKLGLLVIIFLPCSLWAANICYFSLNNEKEFEVTEKLMNKLNSVSTEKVSVREYQTKGGEPEESFHKMLESGAKCDGLVISGHHTGSFGGKRAQGTLGIDFLERMSCDPRYKNFFGNIKAVWLQGCRTLGQEIVGNEEDSADFHRERVGEVLEEDHLEQGFAQLEMEFSDTLDRENPLSGRYLRVFPRATVFGWTRTAPGEKAGSQLSLLYHLAHMGRLTDDRQEYFEDPSTGLSEETALHYANTFRLLFERENILDPRCSEFYEQLAVDAWLFHGQAKTDDEGNPLPLSFQNPDIQAYTSLDATGNPLLNLAKELGCDLKKPDLSYKDLRGILERVLQDENLIGHNFNDLMEVVNRYEKKGGNEWEDLRRYLKNSRKLKNFIAKKLDSPAAGNLRKIDYYAFYHSLGIPEKLRENIEKNLLVSAFAELTREIASDDYNRRDYIQTLMQSLNKHEILRPEHYDKLIGESKNELILSFVAKSIGDSKHPIEGVNVLLKKIVASEKAGGNVLAGVARVIGNSQHPIEGASEILKKIVASEKARDYVLGGVGDGIGNSKYPIEGASEILKKIVVSEKARDYALEGITHGIGNSKYPIEGASEILKKIVVSEKAGDNALAGVAYVIGNSNYPTEEASELLKKIVVSEKAGGYALGEVARAIGNSQYPIEGASEVLKKIVASEKAGDYVLGRVTNVIEGSPHLMEKEREELRQMLAERRGK